MVKFTERDYSGAIIKYTSHERAEIETKNTFIDPMTRVDFDYTEASFILQWATQSITSDGKWHRIFKEKQIFYRIDDLYRLAPHMR